MPEEKILFVSLSNIGDAIMTTPVLAALHDHYPNAIVDIVADARSSALFEHCPFRGQIYHKDKRRFLRGVPALLKQLWRQHYDLAVDLRTDGLVWLLRAGKRLAKRQARSYGAHSVEKHMGVIHSLHGHRPIPPCCLWLNDALRAGAEKRTEGYQRLLAVGPGANWSEKIWPQKNFIKLIEKVRPEFDAVILLGNNQDHVLSRSIQERVAIPGIDCCGKTTLLEAAALLERARVFVGNDSGLGHMASAMGTATVTIFGPGQPAVYRPWGERARWLAGDDQHIHNVSVDAVTDVLLSDVLADNETGRP